MKKGFLVKDSILFWSLISCINFRLKDLMYKPLHNFQGVFFNVSY